jgi:C4-dicarboxylate-specific signal transduction histidine kinase
LNSVNVSATLAGDRLRNSKLSRLDQAATLITKHADDLPAFTASEKGRQFPSYLKKLAYHLAEEQQSVSTELDLLRKNVDHIKDIVAMQQSLAKASGVIEPVQASDLIDDALRMNLSSLTNHNVKIVRDYKTKREISVEKHKVLQILINIIRNAKHACVDGGRIDKQIILTATDKGPETVQITVRDNGIGIPAENLTRIFSHGFTTRKNGHGFGLHSSANAARELGGSLSVASDGAGTGAIFVLQLPVQQKPALHNSRPALELNRI